MLIKLTTDQIAELWDIIKYAIENSLPPIAGEGPDKINNIFESLLVGTHQCWMSYTMEEEEVKKLQSIVVTTVTHDSASDTKNLLIYTMFGYRFISDKEWADGFKVLAKYAKSEKCQRIVAYSSEPRVIKMAELVGGESKYTFLLVAE